MRGGPVTPREHALAHAEIEMLKEHINLSCLPPPVGLETSRPRPKCPTPLSPRLLRLLRGKPPRECPLARCRHRRREVHICRRVRADGRTAHQTGLMRSQLPVEQGARCHEPRGSGIEHQSTGCCSPRGSQAATATRSAAAASQAAMLGRFFRRYASARSK